MTWKERWTLAKQDQPGIIFVVVAMILAVLALLIPSGAKGGTPDDDARAAVAVQLALMDLRKAVAPAASPFDPSNERSPGRPGTSASAGRGSSRSRAGTATAPTRTSALAVGGPGSISGGGRG